MTRFKELRRIEAAIEHNNKADLQWALSYCQMRITIAPRKSHRDHWNKIERKVRHALEIPNSRRDWAFRLQITNCQLQIVR